MTDTLPALETLDLDGAAVAFRRRPGQGPCLVMLHGLGCDQDTFAAAFSRKELRTRPLLTLDFPGFGHSSLPQGYACTLPAWARTTLSLLDALGLGRVHLLGHSMGGSIAVLLARDLGPRLASLISVEGTMLGEECALSREIARMDKANFGSHLFPILAQRLSDDERSHYCLEHTRARALHEGARSLVTWAERGSLLADFLALDAPRLYVHGASSLKDPVLERMRTKTRMVADARISAAGHFSMHANPGGFYGVVADFLAELPAAPPA